MSIRQIKHFVDDGGREVISLANQDISDPAQDTIHKGQFAVMTPQGPIKLSCDFPDDYDIEKCFDEFDVFAEKAVAKKQKEVEAEASRIVTPGNDNQIITP